MCQELCSILYKSLSNKYIFFLSFFLSLMSFCCPPPNPVLHNKKTREFKGKQRALATPARLAPFKSNVPLISAIQGDGD